MGKHSMGIVGRISEDFVEWVRMVQVKGETYF